jgi:hypothetical protein
VAQSLNAGIATVDTRLDKATTMDNVHSRYVMGAQRFFPPADALSAVP